MPTSDGHSPNYLNTTTQSHRIYLRVTATIM